MADEMEPINYSHYLFRLQRRQKNEPMLALSSSGRMRKKIFISWDGIREILLFFGHFSLLNLQLVSFSFFEAIQIVLKGRFCSFQRLHQVQTLNIFIHGEENTMKKDEYNTKIAIYTELSSSDWKKIMEEFNSASMELSELGYDLGQRSNCGQGKVMPPRIGNRWSFWPHAEHPESTFVPIPFASGTAPEHIKAFGYIAIEYDFWPVFSDQLLDFLGGCKCVFARSPSGYCPVINFNQSLGDLIVANEFRTLQKFLDTFSECPVFEINFCWPLNITTASAVNFHDHNYISYGLEQILSTNVVLNRCGTIVIRLCPHHLVRTSNHSETSHEEFSSSPTFSQQFSNVLIRWLHSADGSYRHLCLTKCNCLDDCRRPLQTPLSLHGQLFGKSIKQFIESITSKFETETFARRFQLVISNFDLATEALREFKQKNNCTGETLELIEDEECRSTYLLKRYITECQPNVPSEEFSSTPINEITFNKYI